MILPKRVRRATLTVHVAVSVGWLGAVATSLVLALTALTSRDIGLVRASLIALPQIGRAVLLPLSVASLLSGVVQGLGSKWGVLSNYWVVTKLAINAVAIAVLLLYLETLEHLGGLATSGAPLRQLRSASPVVHAGGAVVLLLVATVLSIFKPPGLTPRGFKRVQDG